MSEPLPVRQPPPDAGDHFSWSNDQLAHRMRQTYQATGDKFFWHAAERLEIEANIRDPRRSDAQRAATVERSIAAQLAGAMAEIGELKRRIEAAEAEAESAHYAAEWIAKSV